MVVPPKHPKMIQKWSFLVGKPMVVGYHHFRKSPYQRGFLPCFFNIPGFTNNISDEIQASSEDELTAGSPQIHRSNWRRKIIFHQTFMSLGFMGVLYFHAFFSSLKVSIASIKPFPVSVSQDRFGQTKICSSKKAKVKIISMLFFWLVNLPPQHKPPCEIAGVWFSKERFQQVSQCFARVAADFFQKKKKLRPRRGKQVRCLVVSKPKRWDPDPLSKMDLQPLKMAEIKWVTGVIKPHRPAHLVAVAICILYARCVCLFFGHGISSPNCCTAPIKWFRSKSEFWD